MKYLFATIILVWALALRVPVFADEGNSSSISKEEAQAAEVVQRQLDAYNSGDLEAFVSTYHENVVLRSDGREPFATSLEDVRRVYGELFERAPDIYAVLISRSVEGNRVTDQEYVVGIPGRVIEAIAVYDVEGGKIRTVTFYDVDQKGVAQ